MTAKDHPSQSRPPNMGDEVLQLRHVTWRQAFGLQTSILAALFAAVGILVMSQLGDIKSEMRERQTADRLQGERIARVEGRLSAAETVLGATVRGPEFEALRTEIRDRLDRIERKLDDRAAK